MDKEKEKILNKLFNNKFDLNDSVNYQFSSKILKNIVYLTNFDFDKYFNNEEETKSLIFVCLILIEYKGLQIPKDFVVNHSFAENEYKKAIIFSLPDNKIECESNFVAITKNKNNEIYYFTNEYYEFTDRYGLCMSDKNTRYITSFKPKTYEEFKNAIFEYNE